ncbi:hypothetical protein FisN_20Lh037 [Fistulifera solaris]|uniref:Uncharacterized protein n=1 Tax=Fistulifera solaris TaxID=1519565 RepID=A0A1Z5JWN2_FISSO|nr:hypothetical protein FisN_20Lh037 [Fistulifera solaris]|eukprot:GAX18276.1 hypothetical protein FisN_20Lh037 [Fistulifera solaris]
MILRLGLFLVLIGRNHSCMPLVQAFRVHRYSVVPLQHFRGGAANVPPVSQKAAHNATTKDAITTTTTTTTTKTTTIRTTKVPVGATRRSIWTIGSLAVLSLILFQQRAIWLPLINKDLILQRTLELLEPLQSNRLGWIYYSCGLALWEFCGLSTIPVETAAGMVLGWKAVGASLLGKLTGAMLAFGIGRCWLYQHVATQLEHNEIFQLINQASSSGSASSVVTASSYSPFKSNTTTTTTLHPHSPLLTAFLMKFSCFPEMIKNFGSSLLPVIQWWMFAAATLIHGGTFTVLWTWLGHQTSTGSSGSSSTTIALSIAAFMGVVVTPLVMAWWIQDLKKWAESNSKPQSSATRIT